MARTCRVAQQICRNFVKKRGYSIRHWVFIQLAQDFYPARMGTATPEDARNRAKDKHAQRHIKLGTRVLPLPLLRSSRVATAIFVLFSYPRTEYEGGNDIGITKKNENPFSFFLERKLLEWMHVENTWDKLGCAETCRSWRPDQAGRGRECPTGSGDTRGLFLSAISLFTVLVEQESSKRRTTRNSDFATTSILMKLLNTVQQQP